MLDYSPFYRTLKTKKISQYELRHMGVSPTLLSSIRCGKSISLYSVNKLCAILECNPHEIFSITVTREEIEYFKQFRTPSHRQDLHKHPLKSDEKLIK